MAWEFHLTDLLGEEIAEIRNAGERKVSLPHMRVPTATCRIPLWHSLADTVLGTDTLLKCYRRDPVTGSRSLAFFGPVISAEEAAEGNSQTIAIEAAGPYWRVNKRILGTSKAGISYGSASVPRDLGLIAHDILDTINGQQYTGIAKGTRVATVSGYVGPYWLKNAAEAITEITSGLSTFEFENVPTEATQVGGVGGWPKIADMNIAPLISTVRDNAIFEYGTTKANVGSYGRKVDRSGILTRAIVPIQGWPDAPFQQKGLRIRSDAPTMASRGLFEEVVNDAGVTDDSLRDKIGDFHLLIRKNPRQVITFRPVVNARPAPFVDYRVGDQVRARAVVRGSVRFDAMFRIWGLTFDIDQNGNESVELELVMP